MAKTIFEEMGGKYERQGDYLIPCLTVPTIFEEMGGTYIRHGDYLIPALTLPKDVGRILRTFKIKKNVEVTDNGKDNF